jgi:hypothetical protein
MEGISFLIRKRLRSKTTDLGRATISKPAIQHELAVDEATLGFSLPPLLKQIYLEVGNGGFGPGYGLLGMSNGARDDLGRTAPEKYWLFKQGDPDDAAWSWPEALLPICHWGCAIYSCISCADPNFPMRIFDPNLRAGPSWEDAHFVEAVSFSSWIRAWAQGKDLWDTMYGDNGRVTRLLLARGGTRKNTFHY